MSYQFVRSAVDLGRARGPRLAFVVHMAEGGGTVGYLSRQNPNGVSVHFVIERSGRTVQMLNLDRMHTSLRASAIRTTNDADGFYGAKAARAVMGAWADTRTTLGPNHASIAVEIEGFAKDGPNAAQTQALKALYTDLAKRYPGIRSLGHRDFASYKACPGKRIPWSLIGGHGTSKPAQPAPQPATPAKEEPVATDPNVRLAQAIIDRGGYLKNELEAGQKADALGQLAKVNEFAGRILTSLAPTTPPTADDPDIETTPISDNPSIAIHQILTATGHPVTFNEAGASVGLDPVAVLRDATPEQQRELALLGFFGQKGTRNDVDYSLWEQYYDQDADGNAAPKPEYANTGTWQAYLASKG